MLIQKSDHDYRYPSAAPILAFFQLGLTCIMYQPSTPSQIGYLGGVIIRVVCQVSVTVYAPYKIQRASASLTGAYIVCCSILIASSGFGVRALSVEINIAPAASDAAAAYSERRRSKLLSTAVFVTRITHVKIYTYNFILPAPSRHT
jgi:hypothetical protein